MIRILCLLLFAISSLQCKNEIQRENERVHPKIDIDSARSKAKEALQFCRNNGYNTDFYIAIDMSLHSGVKRFFVWNFKNDTILNEFLVSHGCCSGSWGADNSKNNPVFSNVPDSHCSSLGKYKIGERGYSNWGVNVKYILHGLEATNSNAQRRIIVFHSWERVSDEEIYPRGTPEGWGCPAVSNNSFRIIDPLLKNSTKPVLMWIYQ